MRAAASIGDATGLIVQKDKIFDCEDSGRPEDQHAFVNSGKPSSTAASPRISISWRSEEVMLALLEMQQRRVTER
eukprot:3721658-Pyramimonas_sp.AAC.1